MRIIVSIDLFQRNDHSWVILTLHGALGHPAVTSCSVCRGPEQKVTGSPHHLENNVASLRQIFRIAAVFTLFACAVTAQTPSGETSAARMDLDLLEVTVPQLERFYREHRYTITQVVSWYIDRIKRYGDVYGAIEDLDTKGALETAAREDAAMKSDADLRGLLWGVPIVIKENTSVKGLVTTDGWKGYVIPGHELVAQKDATIVAKLRAAGAVILGKTNMPDFAASDTNRSTSFGRTGNAYDVRFSPGGSSGGTVTAVTANMAVLGNGTDTGNSIRMPAATSAVVGVFPTRGLVSIAGIAPLDWLLDNTGPIARDVTDTAIALSVIAGEDPLDPATHGSTGQAQPGPYTQYLKRDALRGKRFGVPAFILAGAGIPFQGIPAAETPEQAGADRKSAELPLRPETRAVFMKAVEALRAAGATVVFDDSILPDSFAETASRIGTLPYIREGTEKFLAEFGPAQYHSPEEYERAVGSPLPATIIGGDKPSTLSVDQRPVVKQQRFENNPQAEADVLGPKRRALQMYEETLDRLHLDGYVYPAIQMPPPDETMPQDGVLSTGPHSDTGWVNMLGVPAVVVPAGFYASGLPFGLEISARRWHDGDLLGWAYAFEQATHLRKPPLLVDKGLLSIHP
jgi:Asp-tRNA(Asn)/Glu-tRNA(Gln) amidotransferase A subunit family amidase